MPSSSQCSHFSATPVVMRTTPSVWRRPNAGQQKNTAGQLKMVRTPSIFCFHFDLFFFYSHIYWETKIKYISARGSWISNFTWTYFCFSDGTITSRTCAETCDDSQHGISCCDENLCWGWGHRSAFLFRLCSIRTLRINLYDLFSKFCDYHLSKSSYFLRWKHVEFEFHVFQIY